MKTRAQGASERGAGGSDEAAVDQAERDAEIGERPAVVLSEVIPGKRARHLVVLDFDAWAADVAVEPDKT